MAYNAVVTHTTTALAQKFPFMHKGMIGVKVSLYAQRHDLHKLFPLGTKAILAKFYTKVYMTTK